MTTNKPVETHAAAELSSESAEKLLRAESTPRPEQGADQATSVSITSHRAAQEILAPEDDEDFQAFLAECGLPPSKPRVSAANADASAAFSSSPDTTTAATTASKTSATASKTSATASKTTRVAAGTAGLADSVGSEPVRKGASNSSSQRVKPDAGAEGPDPNNAEDYAAFQAFLAECHGTSNSSQATSKQATPSEGVAVGAAVGATAKSKGASAHTCGDISGVGQGQAGSSKFTDNSASLGSHNASGSATGSATGANGSEPSGAGFAPASVALGAVVGAAANVSGTASDSSDSSGATGASGTASAPQKASRPRMKRARRKHEFWRSLQFRVMMIFAFAGMIATAAMGVMSYLKTYYSTQEFIDEELSQISQVVINYRMVLPRRWESPRHMRERVLRLRNDHGRIIVEYGTIEVPTGQGQDPQAQAAPQQMPRGQGMGMGMGPRYGMQGMHGMHRGAGAAGSGAYAGAGNADGAGAGYGAGGAAPLPEDTLPSIEDCAAVWPSR